MKLKSCEKMRDAIETILKELNLLDKFKDADEFYVKISNEPFMPLSIERHGNQVTVTHYFEQNGDLVPDPDMEFEIYKGRWLPYAIQHSNGKYVRTLEREGEKRIIFVDDYDALLSFSEIWSRNLLDQGFAKGKVEWVE